MAAIGRTPPPLRADIVSRDECVPCTILCEEPPRTPRVSEPFLICCPRTAAQEAASGTAVRLFPGKIRTPVNSNGRMDGHEGQPGQAKRDTRTGELAAETGRKGGRDMYSE